MWSGGRPAIEASRAVVVIAHPDDEVMFFAPTIRSLTSRPGCAVHVLCLSSGDFYGLGKCRVAELVRCCGALGIAESRVVVVEHPQLQDGMDVEWPTELVAEQVERYVAAHELELVITFDRRGVSGHCNHCDVYRGVRHWWHNDGGNRRRDSEEPERLGDEPRHRPTRRRPAGACLTLVTTNVLRKYIGVLDVGVSWFELWRAWRSSAVREGGASRIRNGGARQGSGGEVGGLVVITSLSPLAIAATMRAMAMHWSQLVWYRALFILFARYTYVNTLRPMGDAREDGAMAKPDEPDAHAKKRR